MSFNKHLKMRSSELVPVSESLTPWSQIWNRVSGSVNEHHMGGRIKAPMKTLMSQNGIWNSKVMRNTGKSALFTSHTHRSSGGDYGWALQTWKLGKKITSVSLTEHLLSHRKTTGRPEPWTSLWRFLLWKFHCLFFLGTDYDLLQSFKMADKRETLPFPV